MEILHFVQDDMEGQDDRAGQDNMEVENQRSQAFLDNIVEG